MVTEICNSKVLFNKFQELRERYHPDSLDFQHSKGYVEQASRNGVFGMLEGENLIVCTNKEASQDSNPVIVSSVGKNREELIYQGAKKLSREFGLDTIVKNVDLNSNLGCKGLDDYMEDESWDKDTKYDDNTYPQQIIDLSEYYGSFKDPKYSSLREEIRRFERNYCLEREECSYDRGKIQFKHLLETWTSQMFSRKDWRKENLVEATRIYSPGRYPFQYFFHESTSKESVGYISMDKISDRCLAINALVNDFSYRNSYRYLIHKSIEIAKEAGYDFLNLQGSEDKKQYESKRRFKAPIEIPKKHLVYRFANKNK